MVVGNVKRNGIKLCQQDCARPPAARQPATHKKLRRGTLLVLFF